MTVAPSGELYLGVAAFLGGPASIVRVSGQDLVPVAGTNRLGSADFAVGADGSIYAAATYENRVYKVRPDGTRVPFAGTGVAGFSGDDGPAVNARLDHPRGVDLNAAGALLIADSDNNRVRVVLGNGVIRTVAGDGETAGGGSSGEGGLATQAPVDHPYDVAARGVFEYWITEPEAWRVRLIVLP